MGLPIEVAAVDNAAPHRRGMAVHVLGGGVGHDVGSPLEGPAVDGGGEGVVDDEGYAVGVSHAGEAFNVEHVATGVGDGFAEEAFRVGTECFFYLFIGSVGVDKGAFDAHLLHGHAEEVERAAVDGAGGDEMVAGFADVEHGIEAGGLSAGGEHGGDSAFELGYLGGYGVVGGVLQTSVEITAVLEVEQTRHLFAVVIFEGGALVDGEHAGLALLGLPSGLHTEGGGFHG